MKDTKWLFNMILILLFSADAMGQSRAKKEHNHPSGNMHAVGTGINLPIGNFSLTHSVGVAAEYSWSHYRFGKMDVKPVKPFGLIANSGIAYYPGKKEAAGNYPYKYPAYTFLHLFGGVMYNPWNKGLINFSLGPALGMYNGINRFNIGAKLDGTYFFNEKFGISPVLIMMKEQGADALWLIAIKASYCF
ncbi:MAG: hypothetical protein HZB42_06590 [Sphingobacteriales bacterium]|nr:hypothetical protein [Sphingobacteriales bacterium]